MGHIIKTIIATLTECKLYCWPYLCVKNKYCAPCEFVHHTLLGVLTMKCKVKFQWLIKCSLRGTTGNSAGTPSSNYRGN